MNKANYTKSIKWILFVLCCIVSLLLLARFFESQKAYAEVGDGEIDYSFEEVPIEKIDICTERNISEVKPSESFSVTYRLSPWYTTAESVYFNVSPSGAAKVLQISNVKIENGQAFGDAVIEVSTTADVGSVFTVTANANGIYSNEIEMTVAKIPIEQIKLSFADSDDKLHIGKSKKVSCEVLPKTASNKSVRYELSGSGMKYIKEFDSKTGVVTAVSDVSNVQADSIIVVTAFAEDDSAVSDSIVISFYVPSITVQLSASTPLGGKTADNEALAVANSRVGETVQMHATVNGVDTTGLNYVIVQGREYIENGLIRGDGSFTIKPTSTWTASMKKPHAEIRVRAAYSDGFDEIGISIYVPVEQLLFIDSDVRRNVENNRSYDLAVKALPEYATFLNDSLDPFVYTLNGLDSCIATVDAEGLVSLPKSLTSKGNVINYTASLNGAWDGVDVAPLNYEMSIVPVSANDITDITIKKNGVSISDKSVKVMPDDILAVEVEYDKDNVTELDFTLIENSPMISTSDGTIIIENISRMTEDNPRISLTLKYNGETAEVIKPLDLYIYVPAETASITQVPLNRDSALDLRSLVTINGHGHASNKTITWGDVKIGNQIAKGADCTNGILTIDSKTTAGTKVTVLYHTQDNSEWEQQEFTVAPLSNDFTLVYSKDRNYTIRTDAPQLEEGQSVGLQLAYKGLRGKNFGLKYKLYSSANSSIKENIVDQNNNYDEFTLLAQSGQSGKNNYIEYLIEIQDGDNTRYYMGTQGYNKLSPAGTYMNSIAIFNRINGNISVSNNSVEKGDAFILSGWDALATFNERDLTWSVNGKTLSDRIFNSVINSGFILNISAAQQYNNDTITFSAKIAFSSIIYKTESGEILKRTYKKEGATIILENSLGEKKENYAQTGWSKNINGSRDYAFKSNYSESADLTLYAYWNSTVIKTAMGSSFASEETMEMDFCAWTKVDDISGYFNSYTSVDNLKKVGYTKVTISIDIHIIVYGDIEMYLQIYDVTDRKELSCSSLYHSPNGGEYNKSYSFTFDISKLDNTHEIQLRFKGRRYVAIWGGRVTIKGNRNYTVKFE